VLVAIIVDLVRWHGGIGSAYTLRRGARDTNDLHARGEMDHEEYMNRKSDIAGG
jgi:uncharacterized membrane protein